MSQNHHQFHFPNFFHTNNTNRSPPFKLEQTLQHTFDERNNHNTMQKDNSHHDQRTEDQVRNDLNFSIQDLLTKITKATADFQQQPKLLSQSQKQQQRQNSFKNSNLSASTESNSNHEKSDRVTEKYQQFVQKNKKRQSEPQKEAFSNNDRFRQTNPQKHNTVKHGFGEVRNNQNNEAIGQHQGSNWNTIMKSDGNIDLGRQEVKTQQTFEWGRSSSRNQPSFTQFNSNVDPINEWGRSSSRNQPVYSYKQTQPVTEWGRNSSRNQPNFQPMTPQVQNQAPLEWGRNSSRNQPKVQLINQWTSHTPKNTSTEQRLSDWKNQVNINEWGQNPAHKRTKTETNQQFKINELRNQSNKVTVKNNKEYDPINQFKSSQTLQQWGRASSRNQPLLNEPKTFETTSFKNIMEGNRSPQLKQQLPKVTPKQQLCNPFQTLVKIQPTKQPSTKIQPPQTSQQQQVKPPKREIQALLNPFQNSGFGKNPNDVHKKPQKTRQIAASIIIEDNPPAEFQQIPIGMGKKVNSLFDTKKIRQVAASTIMESPEKMKKNKNTKSPFMEIAQTNSPDPIKQEASTVSEYEVPSIKIHNVQKSQLLPQDLNGPKLTIQDFQLGKQLGSGKFGDVYQAVHKQTGVLYAIKKIFKSTILEYNMVEQFTRQLKIHYSLNYPNIIKLFTHFDDDYHVFLVMEYGEGGMLMEKVKNGEKFASVIVEQMLRAVEYLQNKKIAHRDIKPENIVLMFGDTAKMCDFGWSRVFDSDMKKTFCGTLDYVSPEMKDKGEYSLKIDIWSLGVLTFELLCGFAPFKDEITNWKRKGGNMNKAWNWNILYPPEVSSVAESFMRNLLKQNPNDRANIRACLGHLFVRKYNQMNYDEGEDKRFHQIASILN